MNVPESRRPGLRAADTADVAEEWETLAATLDNLDDPILVTDLEGEIVLMNREAERLFVGLPEDEAEPGRTEAARANVATLAKLVDDLRSGEGERGVADVELRDTRTLTDFPTEVVSSEIVDAEGEPAAIVSVIHDRTPMVENERLARELERLNAELEDRIRLATMELEERNRRLEWQSRELEKAARLKSEFLASMSHELRTPINAVIGYTSLLREEIYGELTERQKDGLDKVNTASQHLLELVNDILDLSKIEAGKMPVDPEEVSLQQVIGQLVHALEPLARDKEIDLTAEIEDDVPTLLTDRTKLRQVLMNLLSNAVKFTSDGGVTVTAGRVGENRVVVSVADTGIGIKAGDLEGIFDAFWQVDQSATREYGGTGLGLSITRDLVRLLDGDISVDSEYGEGTTFEVELPVRIPPGRRAEQLEQALSSGRETPTPEPD